MSENPTAPQSATSPAAEPSSVPRTRRIAILGFGETVREAPVNDPSWELWAMNGFWRAAKPDFGIDVPEDRYSLWWDMHSVEYTRAYGKVAGFGDAQERWLEKEHPFPIFMLDEDPAFPSVKRFPIDEVVAAAGRDYFTSTVAYAVVYAALQPDVAEIGLWGIDLVHDTEYVDQRPCAEYWLAKAEDAGIKVTVHARSALMKARRRYGYEPDADGELSKGLRAMLTQQLQHIEKVTASNLAKVEMLNKQLHTDDGAAQAIRGVLQRLDIYERGGTP